MLSEPYATLFTELSAFIPAERLVTDPLRTLAFGTDASFYRLVPKMVVQVENEQEVRWVLERARAHATPVTFRAAAHVQDFLPMSRRDIVLFEGCEEAWKKAHADAGTTLEDLSFVETHDCFTIAELIEYEAMGLVGHGEGARVVSEGWTNSDGKLPINVSGGLKSKGHPIGATGVSMHVISAMQLTGEAGDMQLPKADRAGIYNMGGVAVANYVSVLERVKAA